jgi:formate-dependent nitrite reductase membrane component NrfD
MTVEQVLVDEAARPSSPALPPASSSRRRSEIEASNRPLSIGKDGRIVTYYDQPALKASLWGWKVSTYIFLSGLAGSAQIIATAADLAGDRRDRAIVRDGRYLAFAGALFGAPLLIMDLHTPQRFYHMLRIFRPTSPMSIGTYVLVGFGGLSAILAAAQLRRDMSAKSVLGHTASRFVQLPAAVLGAAMSTYTGALLGATSTPLWAAAPRLLPALFGASAMASAAAALSLTSRGAGGAALGRIEAVASAVELCLLTALRHRLRSEGVRTSFAAAPLWLTAAVPVLHQAAAALEIPKRSSPEKDVAVIARRSAKFGTAAAVAVLAGAFLLRHAILRAGNRSSQRPRDYFRLARPR